MPSIGPHNPALGEIYQRLYPEMRRPKPNQEAIAAALQAMQRLTMESDSEAAAEDATLETTSSSHHACHACGHHNREGNKFCGMCGLPLEPRHPNRQIPYLPFTPCRLSTTRTCRNLDPQRGKPSDEVHPQPGLPRARITTTTTTIITIFRAAQAPRASRVPTPPRAREKPTG